MLNITNLDKTYASGVQALKDVSLNIPAGMFGLPVRTAQAKQR
jgi:ABC-2 type transport system ATP-binding protein